MVEGMVLEKYQAEGGISNLSGNFLANGPALLKKPLG
jgi:hypothetical protein